jgi:hypothetical protein
MEQYLHKHLHIRVLSLSKNRLLHRFIQKYCLIGNTFRSLILIFAIMLLSLSFPTQAQPMPERMPPQFPPGHTGFPPEPSPAAPSQPGIPPPSPTQKLQPHPAPPTLDPGTPQPPPSPDSAASPEATPLPPSTPIPAQEIIPQSYTADRYQSLWKRSPFTLPSAAVETPVKAAGLEQKFILQSVAIIEGEPIVTLYSKDKQTSITITKEPLEEEDGLRIVSIDDSKVTEGEVDDVTKLIVKIANKNEQGEIRFDSAQLTQQTAMPGDMLGGMPGMHGAMPQASIPASIPAVPSSSSSSVDSSPTTPPPPTPPPASSQQRRRMVIPSTPPPSDNPNP